MSLSHEIIQVCSIARTRLIIRSLLDYLYYICTMQCTTIIMNVTLYKWHTSSLCLKTTYVLEKCLACAQMYLIHSFFSVYTYWYNILWYSWYHQNVFNICALIEIFPVVEQHYHLYTIQFTCILYVISNILNLEQTITSFEFQWHKFSDSFYSKKLLAANITTIKFIIQLFSLHVYLL